jgi:3D (Asp-Asp-Asp) domain-containing protein
MKITLKRTPEQIELVKAMASRNRTVAYDAQVALAEFIGPVLAEVVNNAPTLSNLFTSLPFNADDNPSIPLDLYYDITDEDYITVYSQSVAGGLPTNQVLPTVSEMKVTTYSLDSALSFDRRYAAKHRMDVVAKTFTRMAQEILLKQERTSATLVMSTLAAASTNSKAHVQRSNQSGRFLLADLNELLTLAKRINTSWTKGTPASGARAGISDLLVSPEIVEQIRAMAYNPVNTLSGITASGGTASTVGIPATDEMRSAIYGSAGIPSFYGVSILEFNEMGKSQKFNTIFDTAAGATAYTTAAGGSSGAFDGANEEILVGIDRSRDSLLRVVATDPDSNSEFSLVADDQYSIRQNKIGYFGSLEEGRVILDVRALVGKIV